MTYFGCNRHRRGHRFGILACKSKTRANALKTQFLFFYFIDLETFTSSASYISANIVARV